MKARSLLLPLAVLGLAACGEARQTHPLAADAPRGSLSAATTLEILARGLAQSMEQPAARTAVRDAMRRSPLTEHKLDLREFAGTPEGALVIEQAARAVGMRAEDVRRMVEGLPPTDFYAPFRQHRLRWQGSAEVVVAAVGESRSDDLLAYDVNGTQVRFQRSRGVPHTVILMLRPAEARGVRLMRSGPKQGETIQEPDEMDIGISSTEPGACDGFIREDTCSEGGGTSAVPTDTTRVVSLGIDNHWDEWWDETNEVIVEGGVYRPQTGDDPCLACTRKIYTGVRAGVTYYPSNNFFVAGRVDPAYSDYLFFNFREEDDYINDDQIGHTYREGIPLYSSVDKSINNNGTPTKIYRWTEHKFHFNSEEYTLYSGNENGQVTAQWTPR